MKKNHILKTVAGGLFFLNSLPVLSAPQDLPVRHISMPALSMITESLNALVPKLNGERNLFLMQQICSLARGERLQQQVDLALQQNGIDPARIPLTGNSFSLLVNGNIEQQQTVCAAWLATSLSEPVNSSTWYHERKEQETEIIATPQNTINWKFWETQELPRATMTEEERKASEYDKNKLISEAKVTMALSQATAKLYALIANNIPTSPVTEQEYQANVLMTVSNYAGEYLRTIQMLYHGRQPYGLSIHRVSATGFTVADEQGYELERVRNKTSLRYQDVDWLGNGKIMGKDYFVNLKVIADPVIAVQRVEPTEKVLPKVIEEELPKVVEKAPIEEASPKVIEKEPVINRKGKR
ncbi:hypothetical protein [Pragia fontium]|uniref:Uncharacterized protein n=2 Tax=Pragia fontium TaxID=82985 RepID=A0AAJ4WCL6_9GAMM|nr:hypothetical protein [Pragia fontium]SFD24453.1 hypothetical protein SAMN02745723_1113 [Pragia fontium DSM 5563 = ATCC 49100]